MMEQLKELWQEAFDSSTSYTNLFFDYLYTDSGVRFTKENGLVLSVAYTLPYPMRVLGQLLPASYLCGVATKKTHRGKGLVSSLMRQTLQDLYHEGDALCGLIPMNNSLYDFYFRFDFSPIYKGMKKEVIKTGESSLTLSPLTEYENCAELYNRTVAAHSFSYQIPASHFEFLAQESRMFGETPHAVYQNGRFCGYIFFTEEKGLSLSRELVLEPDISPQNVFNALYKQYNLSNLTVYTPSFYNVGGEEFNLGMLRIVNVANVLSAVYTAQKTPVSFHITDDIIPENNGIFTVQNGRTKKNKSEDVQHSLTVRELLDFLTEKISPTAPYINMLLN